MNLPEDQIFDRIVHLLQPHLGLVSERRELVKTALYNCKVLDDIEWEGATSAFTPLLVNLLLTSEPCNSGFLPIADLLSRLQEIVGVEQQAEIDDLLEQLATKNKPIFRNPYKALRAFDESDSADYFGRVEFIEQMLNRLSETGEYSHFLAVIGPSGSGKSSVVKAGLLPKIRSGRLPQSEQWRVIVMSPRNDPFNELKLVLLQIIDNLPDTYLNRLGNHVDSLAQIANHVTAQFGSTLFLVIDQFEELFTTFKNEIQRRTFLNTLIEALQKSNIWIVITLRADFFDKPLKYPNFGRILQTRTEVLLVMSNADLIDAIVQPAKRVGVTVEAGLENLIIRDLDEQSGSLPLLQYTLNLMFEKSGGQQLTKELYDEIGGVKRALVQQVDSKYGNLPDEQYRLLAKWLFLRLIEVDPDNPDIITKRRITFDELQLPDDEQTQKLEVVVYAFVNARILVTNRTSDNIRTLEIGHDAFIYEWGKLRDWIKASIKDSPIRKNLEANVADWLRQGMSDDVLYRGKRLADTQSWSQNNIVNAVEVNFIKKSAIVEAKRIQSDRNRTRILIALSIAGLFALTAFVVAAVIANNSIDKGAILTLRQSRLATLAAGGVVINSENLNQTPVDFVATETAIARAVMFKPIIEQFDDVEMVLVPAGCFWMGSSAMDADEQPVHERCFEQPFWIDRYEVSIGQFNRLHGIAEFTALWEEDDSISQADVPLLPRTDIAWDEAQAFCENQRHGHLPTEAEWEYAARGPDSLKYPWGNEFDEERVHAQTDRDDRPVAVNSTLAGISWVGAAHMSGNVAEWVYDVYAPYDTNPPEVGERVYRGGAY